MKSRDSLKNERVPVFFKKSFKLCVHSIKNIDAKLYLLKIHKTDDKTKKLCYIQIRILFLIFFYG